MDQYKKMPSVRIIGGKWRSRRVYFHDTAALRPTQDRVRETLFNWLSHHIVEARCLDLFAGSGVLGFEALSRGAKEVAFIDHDSDSIQAIKDNAVRLKATSIDTYRASIPTNIPALAQKKYDIIFLDPPFSSKKLMPSLDWLLRHQLMTSDALIYFEADIASRDSLDDFPGELIKEKKTKTMVYGLMRLQ